jgi:hypothetical protein
MLTDSGGITSVNAETTCHLCGAVISTFFFINAGMTQDQTRSYRACLECRNFVVMLLDHLHEVALKVVEGLD